MKELLNAKPRKNFIQLRAIILLYPYRVQRFQSQFDVVLDLPAA